MFLLIVFDVFDAIFVLFLFIIALDEFLFIIPLDVFLLIIALDEFLFIVFDGYFNGLRVANLLFDWIGY